MSQLDLPTCDGGVLPGALWVADVGHFLLQVVDVVQHHTRHLVDQLAKLEERKCLI